MRSVFVRITTKCSIRRNLDFYGSVRKSASYIRFQCWRSFYWGNQLISSLVVILSSSVPLLLLSFWLYESELRSFAVCCTHKISQSLLNTEFDIRVDLQSQEPPPSPKRPHSSGCVSLNDSFRGSPLMVMGVRTPDKSQDIREGLPSSFGIGSLQFIKTLVSEIPDERRSVRGTCGKGYTQVSPGVK